MNIRSKAVAATLAGLMALAPVASTVALAAVPTPSVGAQTGTGTTDVTVQLNLDPAITEFGGTIDPNNPDADGNGLGDNIAFTVPAAINYIAAADGTLTGPSADATYIENQSVFGIHASSFDVDAAEGWNIIKDGTTASADNSADFQFGVYAEGDSSNTDMLDAYDYLEKKGVNKATLWNMNDKSTASAAAGADNKVNLTTTGDIAKVNKDISQQTKIATIKTFVSPKLAQ